MDNAEMQVLGSQLPIEIRQALLNNPDAYALFLEKLSAIPGTGTETVVVVPDVFNAALEALYVLSRNPSVQDAYEICAASAVGLSLPEFNRTAPNWTALIGPPGRGKTLVCEAISDNAYTYVGADVTPASLLGAHDNKGKARKKENDLLPQLSDKCFVTEEMSTIFTGTYAVVEQRVTNMAKIYNGSHYRNTANYGRIIWKGRFNWVGGITPIVVQKHYKTMNAIGSRFLAFRILMDVDESHASEEEESEESMTALRRCTARLLQSTVEYAKQHPWVGDANDHIEAGKIAMFVALGRSTPMSDDEGMPLEPQTEDKERIKKQLLNMARSIARLHQRTTLSEHEWRLCRKIALSCLTEQRWQTMMWFRQETLRGGVVSIQERDDNEFIDVNISGQVKVNVSRGTIRRRLNDLVAVNILECGDAPKKSSGDYTHKVWAVRPEYKDIVFG